MGYYSITVFLAKIASYARVIARTAQGEIEFLFGQFKMTSNFFRVDLVYLFTGYFTGIKIPGSEDKKL